MGLCFCCCTYRNENSHPKEPYLLTPEDKALLQNGDIILRKGEGFLSQFICNQLNDTIDVSHCGIIIRNQDQLQVIHALSKDVSDIDGVQSCSIDQFTQESVKASTYIVRFKGDSTHLLASQAQYYLSIRKPFDRLFDLHDTTSFFCSELVFHILKTYLGKDLMQGQSTPKFSLFLNPEIFDIIYSNEREK